jgi:hypothetical protein
VAGKSTTLGNSANDALISGFGGGVGVGAGVGAGAGVGVGVGVGLGVGVGVGVGLGVGVGVGVGDGVAEGGSLDGTEATSTGLPLPPGVFDGCLEGGFDLLPGFKINCEIRSSSLSLGGGFLGLGTAGVGDVAMGDVGVGDVAVGDVAVGDVAAGGFSDGFWTAGDSELSIITTAPTASPRMTSAAPPPQSTIGRRYQGSGEGGSAPGFAASDFAGAFFPALEDLPVRSLSEPGLAGPGSRLAVSEARSKACSGFSSASSKATALRTFCLGGRHFASTEATSAAVW